MQKLAFRLTYCTCLDFVQLDAKSPEVLAAAVVAVEFMNKQFVEIFEGYRKKNIY